MRFYCLDHPQEIRVPDVGAGRVWCDEGKHYLANHFPSEPYWGHCYECKAVWFHRQEMLPREVCPACKRRLGLSHLCHNCETFGYRQLAEGAPVTPPDEGEFACGSCAADLSVARWHFCLTLGGVYRTVRERCPFCGAGFFPLAAAELPAAANGSEYLPMCLGGHDEERTSLVAPTDRGKREVLFSLLPGPRGEAIVLPRAADLERVVRKARAFRRVFDWPHGWAGNLVVERPAIFERDGNRWRLKEFGTLAGSVVGGGAPTTLPASDPLAPAAEGAVDKAAGEVEVTPAEGAAEMKTRAPETGAAAAATPQGSGEPGADTRVKTARAETPDGTRRRAPGGQNGGAGVGAAAAPEGRPAFGLPVRSQSETFISSTKIRPGHIAAVSAVLIGAAFLILYLRSSRGDVPPPPNPPPTPFVSPTPVRTAPPEVAGMVYVRGGTFRMGRDDGDDYERPAHEVTVDPFYIDRFEVTCEEYQLFVDKEKRRAPPGWRNGKYPEGWARLPVTGVSWDDAVAYAKAVGKRLPTEAEWEFAARGADGRLYPWGSEWNRTGANAEGTGPGRPTEVGLYPQGASPFEAQDMAGNVWEWTADSIRSYEGGNIPEDRLSADVRDGLKVIRGGCYLSDEKSARATYRRGWPAKGAEYTQTGFRCARNAGPQTANRK